MERIKMFHRVGFALLLATIASVSNASIVRSYYDATGSAVITYTDLGSGQLEIMFDNTTTGDYSSLITGLVFDVVDGADAVSLVSFVSGNSVDLSAYYTVGMDVNNNITPGRTEADLSITTIKGVNGGVYNAADPGSDLSNAFPDIAIMLLQITDPTGWSLQEISNDFLRMQRTCKDGEDSLKTPGMPAVPVPAAAWLFGSGLLCLAGVARRKSHV